MGDETEFDIDSIAPPLASSSCLTSLCCLATSPAPSSPSPAICAGGSVIAYKGVRTRAVLSAAANEATVEVKLETEWEADTKRAMAYTPPHKRASSSSTPTPYPLTSSAVNNPRPLDKIIYAPGCFFRWSPFPPFSPSSDEDEPRLRLESFPIDRSSNTGAAKRLVLVPCSSREAPGGEATATATATATAAAAIVVHRFLPELLAAVTRTTKTHNVPTEELKLSLVARLGNIIFHHDGSPAVFLDSLREAAEAAGEEGSRRRIPKKFYTNVARECLDHMEQSAVKMILGPAELVSSSSRQHYRVMVFDKHRSDSEISCKCIVQQDGKLANYKIELKGIRELVEDISCVSKDLDLRLMLSTKRTLKNLDAEDAEAIEKLISCAVVDPNVKCGLTFGKESINGDRFSIVAVWRADNKAFSNETLRLKLSVVERFDLAKLTQDPVSNEVTFKLKGITKKLQDGDLEVDTLKEMLEDAVGMIWNNALNYKTAP